jgi:hypothetical protein
MKDFSSRTIERFVFAAVCAALLACAPAAAQAPAPPPLRLDGMAPGGLRVSATETWGVFQFDVTNLTDVDRLARLVVFFDGRPEEQYSRDLWAPAHAAVSSWMPVGPAVPSSRPNASDIQVLLYDLTDGQERLVLPPGEERVRSRPVYFQKREPYTVVLADDPLYGAWSGDHALPWGQLPQPVSEAEEAVYLARVLRQANSLSEFVHVVAPDALPPTAEAFDGVDYLIVASDGIARDPAGVRALREWIEGGGHALVMLDRVRPETLTALLGAAVDFQVVDRVHLTEVKVETRPAEGRTPEPWAERYDRPVDFVRVLLPPPERATHTVNGWPAWFLRRVGRGKVLFTTLGPRAWYRPRKQNDPRSPYPSYPDLPVGTPPLNDAATELLPDNDLFHLDSLRALASDEIGYSVVSRGTVALIFSASLAAALAAGVVLARSRRRDMIGWLGPAGALAAATALAVLGASSRQAVPATVAVAQVIEAVPGAEEAPVRGMLAVYRPDSGPVEIGSRQGGRLELDMTGLEGQIRRFRTTDLDSWRWDNVSLPAGVHYASFLYTAPTAGPIEAVARFGPEGVEGRLTAAGLHGMADAILAAPGGRNLAVHLGPDGALTAGAADVLPAGQFLAGAVLSDRQQRRQQVYRDFLQRPATSRSEGGPRLLAWADALDMRLEPSPAARTVGSALVSVPLRLGRPAPGAPVVIPGPLVPYQRIFEGAPVKPTMESSAAAEMQLRFQVPVAALPLHIEHARLTAKIEAPSRRVVVAGRTDAGPVELFGADSPLDPLRIDIADERLLRLDEDGGLHLNVSLGDAANAGGENEKWTIEYLELEIRGSVR